MAAHKLYFHLTWSTLDRRPMIDSPTSKFLEEFFRRAAVREQARVVQLSILATHVHVIVQTPPRFDLARLVQMMKGGSSHAASRLPENKLGLRWTREYSATTVSPGSLGRAVEYLRKQERKHPEEIAGPAGATP